MTITYHLAVHHSRATAWTPMSRPLNLSILLLQRPFALDGVAQQHDQLIGDLAILHFSSVDESCGHVTTPAKEPPDTSTTSTKRATGTP